MHQCRASADRPGKKRNGALLLLLNRRKEERENMMAPSYLQTGSSCDSDKVLEIQYGYGTTRCSKNTQDTVSDTHYIVDVFIVYCETKYQVCFYT